LAVLFFLPSVSVQDFRNTSGSLATLAAIRRASSLKEEMLKCDGTSRPRKPIKVPLETQN
jgi:hypothetical protein